MCQCPRVGLGAASGPPPGTATAKDRVRGRVIELRREGLSTYEISARLAADGTPLNRTSVGEILSEEGFGRLLRHTAEQASTAAATAGRDTQLPRTAALDFATWPQRCDSAKAGLLLLIPDLVALDLPALVKQAGYPGTRVVPATGWLLSLLALKLTRTRASPTSTTCCSPTPQRPTRCGRCPAAGFRIAATPSSTSPRPLRSILAGLSTGQALAGSRPGSPRPGIPLRSGHRRQLGYVWLPARARGAMGPP